MKKSHRRKPRPEEPTEQMPTPPIQAMGGKEERVSIVGQARAEAERSEEEGEVRFDLAPGPGTDELLHGHRRPAARESKTKLRRRKVSPEPRGGPAGLEPEDVQEKPPRRSKRRPTEQLPFEHGESET
jgi:hypothetical protein